MRRTGLENFRTKPNHSLSAIRQNLADRSTKESFACRTQKPEPVPVDIDISPVFDFSCRIAYGREQEDEFCRVVDHGAVTLFSCPHLEKHPYSVAQKIGNQGKEEAVRQAELRTDGTRQV